MSDRSRTGNSYRHTSFRNSGRIAGYAMYEDSYSEESLGGNSFDSDRYYQRVRFPNDDVKPEELNGPCIVIKEGKRKD